MVLVGGVKYSCTPCIKNPPKFQARPVDSLLLPSPQSQSLRQVDPAEDPLATLGRQRSVLSNGRRSKVTKPHELSHGHAQHQHHGGASPYHPYSSSASWASGSQLSQASDNQNNIWAGFEGLDGLGGGMGMGLVTPPPSMMSDYSDSAASGSTFSLSSFGSEHDHDGGAGEGEPQDLSYSLDQHLNYGAPHESVPSAHSSALYQSLAHSLSLDPSLAHSLSSFSLPTTSSPSVSFPQLEHQQHQQQPPPQPQSVTFPATSQLLSLTRTRSNNPSQTVAFAPKPSLALDRDRDRTLDASLALDRDRDRTLGRELSLDRERDLTFKSSSTGGSATKRGFKSLVSRVKEWGKKGKGKASSPSSPAPSPSSASFPAAHGDTFYDPPPPPLTTMTTQQHVIKEESTSPVSVPDDDGPSPEGARSLEELLWETIEEVEEVKHPPVLFGGGGGSMSPIGDFYSASNNGGGGSPMDVATSSTTDYYSGLEGFGGDPNEQQGKVDAWRQDLSSPSSSAADDVVDFEALFGGVSAGMNGMMHAETDADAPGLELTTALPENAKTNDAGVPTYFGLTGAPLVTGVMAGIITAPQFIYTFPACDAAVQGDTRASLLQATYVSIYELGCLAGAIFALLMGNRLGRRRMMQLGSVIMMLGVAIQVSAIKGEMAGVQFCVGRVITGVGNGMNTSTIPSWVAETSKSHNRGLLVCIEASMIATGTAIAYWVDFGLSFVPTSLNWRLPIALQVVFALGLLFGVYHLPESPRWLMHEGRHIEAQRVIAALTGDTYDSEATLLQTRLIMQSIDQSHQMGVVKKRNMFTNGPTQHFRRMLIGASSQFFQQIGGANAVIYFAPVIFKQNLGLDPQLALILGGVNVTVYALAAFSSYYFIEKVGRRKMFLAGTIGQCVSMIIIFACYIGNNKQTLNGSVFGLFLYLAFFGATWLELPWLYPAEINPLRTRTNANAVSTMTNWVWNFAVVQWTPPMLTAITFAVVNACFIPVIWLYYPETSGRTLEEIDLIFAKGFNEKRSYVEVAANMPKMTDEEIEAETRRLHVEAMDNQEDGARSTTSDETAAVDGAAPEDSAPKLQ
ncbi:hypothetical protein RQP46_011195 [Phenoliferia psychrophenolica]